MSPRSRVRSSDCVKSESCTSLERARSRMGPTMLFPVKSPRLMRICPGSFSKPTRIDADRPNAAAAPGCATESRRHTTAFTVTGPAMFCSSTIVAPAFQLHAALDVHRADDVARARIDLHVAAQVLQPHARVVARDVHVAVDALNVEIAIAPVRFDRRSRGNGNIQIGIGLHAVAGLILIGPHDDLVALLDQIERRLLVGAVGVGLLEGANGFLSAGLDLAASALPVIFALPRKLSITMRQFFAQGFSTGASV